MKLIKGEKAKVNRDRSMDTTRGQTNCRISNTMTIVTFTDNMNLLSPDTTSKKELLYDYYPPKASNAEFLGPVARYMGRRATFQQAMKSTIIVGQLFGLNPVLGVTELDATKLRFTYFSGRCLYSIISILGQGFLFAINILKIFANSDSSLSANSSIVFFGSNCVTTIMFLRMAMKWPGLCQHIAMIEASNPNSDGSLMKKCYISCIVILSMALLEHLLASIVTIFIAIDCQPGVNLYKAFLYQSFPNLWALFEYNTFLGFLAQFFNIQCTFNWNFSDVFVVCVSWYLTSRLEQINEKIMSMKGKFIPSSFWRTMREDYTKATNLVRRFDEVISGIVFISFANNLFFICLQLLHLLADGIKVISACEKDPSERPLKGYEQSVYLLYSFLFLMARSLAVSLIASRIHTASLIPAHALYDVPSASYCIEVQRFLNQVHGETVALSGLQFFNVKRGLLLTVAGTIVTYELVLMQFAGVTPTSAPPTEK